VPEVTEYELAATRPNETALVPLKPVPVMVTVVGPGGEGDGGAHGADRRPELVGELGARAGHARPRRRDDPNAHHAVAAGRRGRDRGGGDGEVGGRQSAEVDFTGTDETGAAVRPRPAPGPRRTAAGSSPARTSPVSTSTVACSVPRLSHVHVRPPVPFSRVEIQPVACDCGWHGPGAISQAASRQGRPTSRWRWQAPPSCRMGKDIAEPDHVKPLGQGLVNPALSLPCLMAQACRTIAVQNER
jgi:hypothetical protein